MENKIDKLLEDMDKYLFDQWNYNRSHIDYRLGNNKDGKMEAYQDMRDKLFDLKRVYGIDN